MTQIFRKAEKKDIKKMATLITRRLGTCDIDTSAKGIEDEKIINLKNENHVKENLENYIVCEVDGEVAGMCGLSGILKKNHYGLIGLNKYRETLYLVVDEKFQGHGIGTELLKRCSTNNDVPTIYEAWGDGEYVNSKLLLQRCGFELLKDLGDTWYKDNGYCPSCTNRNKNCNSCKAEIWIKQ